MTTTFKIEIRKECGFTYAKAFGVEGTGFGSLMAVTSLMDQLSHMLTTLEGAAKYGALSPSGLSDLEALRGIFNPKPPVLTDIDLVAKIYKK